MSCWYLCAAGLLDLRVYEAVAAAVTVPVRGTSPGARTVAYPDCASLMSFITSVYDRVLFLLYPWHHLRKVVYQTCNRTMLSLCSAAYVTSLHMPTYLWIVALL